MTDGTTSADEAGNVADANAEAAKTTTSETTTSTTASWRDSLPDDIKSSPSISKFETIEGLAKSYTNLEKMLGADKVVVPKDGDSEGWAKFYKAAGLPDTPDAYEFKAPENIPDGMVYDADLDKSIAGVFHKAGLNRQQAAAAREGLMEIVGKGALDSIEAAKQDQAARAADIQKAEQSLKQEWGAAFEQRGKIAGAAINKFLSPETIAAMDAAGLANNPAIIRDMYNLGVKIAGEKNLIGDGDMIPSTTDLEAQIADHTAKHNAALFDSSHPEHSQRVKEREALFAKRYPEQAA